MGHSLDTRAIAGEVVLRSRPGCRSASPIRTGAVDDPDWRAETTSILVMLARPMDAGADSFDAASMRGSRCESICAGRIADTAMVIAVMAAAAIPSAIRGTDGS